MIKQVDGVAVPAYACCMCVSVCQYASMLV